MAGIPDILLTLHKRHASLLTSCQHFLSETRNKQMVTTHHHDDPDVKFSRPFLAGVLTLCSEEAFILLSGIIPLPIPRSKSTQAPTETKFTYAL